MRRSAGRSDRQVCGALSGCCCDCPTVDRPRATAVRNALRVPAGVGQSKSGDREYPCHTFPERALVPGKRRRLQPHPAACGTPARTIEFEPPDGRRNGQLCGVHSISPAGPAVSAGPVVKCEGVRCSQSGGSVLCAANRRTYPGTNLAESPPASFLCP